MKKILRFLLALSMIVLLAACATRAQPDTLYDFGALPGARADAPLPALAPVSIADIQAPDWLDSTLMFFRLDYANGQQLRPYANSRWSTPPAQLLGQRLKARIAQAGGVALAAANGAANVPVLRIELDDFSQAFDTPADSAAQVRLRAALFNGRTLIAQRNFARQAPAPSADAAGGARALVTASDPLITDMILWLAAQPQMSR